MKHSIISAVHPPTTEMYDTGWGGYSTVNGLETLDWGAERVRHGDEHKDLHHAIKPSDDLSAGIHLFTNN